MTCLWRQGPLTARQLRETLAERRPMTHASISTLLKRLLEKRLITREKGPVGKAFLFRAAVKPHATYRRLVADLLDRVFAGSGVALVASLLDTRAPTPDELEELMALLEELRSKLARKKPTRNRKQRP
jgi:predicted transcriptional regulator